MQYYNFVIFGEEPNYASGLKNVLLSGTYRGYSVYIFKSEEALKNFTKENTADILLISENINKDVRRRIEATRKYVVSSGKGTVLNEDEMEVYKYQRADAIICSVTRDLDNKRGVIDLKDKKLIGVYSPVHRIGNTKFALDLGGKLSGNEMVLYVNMEGYSGRECYFDDNKEGDTGDLIYYLHQENCDMGKVVSMMVSSRGKLDCISPIGIATDLKSVEEKDWSVLFEKIFEETAYTTLILDLGDMVQGLEHILMQCTTVYTRFISDEISKSKIQQYTDNLRAMGYTDVIEHTVLQEIDFKEGEINGSY